jgi:hypothetical protein
VAQGELGEAREDAGAWDGDEVEGDAVVARLRETRWRRSVLEAGQLKGASFLAGASLLASFPGTRLVKTRLPERRRTATGSQAATHSGATSSVPTSRRLIAASK